MGIAQSMQANMEAMQQRQMENMKKQQQEQRENMMKMEIRKAKVEQAVRRAAARDNAKWTGSLAVLALTAVGARRAAGAQVHGALAVPPVILTVATCYLADMGWGNKMERIKADAQEELAKEGVDFKFP